MRKKNGAYLAVAAPLLITPAVLLVSKVKGSMFGLSPQFWGGFVMGLGIVLVIAAVAAMFLKKHDA